MVPRLSDEAIQHARLLVVFQRDAAEHYQLDTFGGSINQHCLNGFASKVGLFNDFWGKLHLCPKNQFD